MGEKTDSIGKPFHLTGAERVALALFLFTEVRPASTEERRRFRDVVYELGMKELQQEAGETGQIAKPKDKAEFEAIHPLFLSRPTIDFLLDKLGKYQTTGINSFMILDVEERLADTQRGTYVPPTVQ